jgi:hypothetical protein
LIYSFICFDILFLFVSGIVLIYFTLNKISCELSSDMMFVCVLFGFVDNFVIRYLLNTNFDWSIGWKLFIYNYSAGTIIWVYIRSVQFNWIKSIITVWNGNQNINSKDERDKQITNEYKIFNTVETIPNNTLRGVISKHNH